MSAWCGRIYKRNFLYSGPFTTQAHRIVEAAGCVELHGGVDFACAYNAAVPAMIGKEHNLGHRVLIHSTAHVQFKGRLACDLSVTGGVATYTVGVHNSVVLILFKVEDSKK